MKEFLKKNLLISLLIILEIFILLNEFEYIHFFQGNILLKSESSFLKGNIYATGELQGMVENCINCYGNKRSLFRIATILRYFPNSLYFDLGGFSDPSNENYYIKTMPFINFFKHVNVSAINLSKRDMLILLNIENSVNFDRIQFLSSNLIVDSHTAIPLKKTAMTALTLSNGKKKKDISIGIIGISDKRRTVGKWNKNIKIVSNKIALNHALTKFKKVKRPDLIFLLFHDSVYELKNLLKDFKKTNIDFIIGNYGGLLSKNISYVNNIPTVFIGNKGNYIGRIQIVNINSKNYYYRYNLIQNLEIIPEDKYLKNEYRTSLSGEN